MNYKQKLIEWNATEKYKSELLFLYSLVNPMRGERILDYGCGLGTAVKMFHQSSDAAIYGYDICPENYLFIEKTFLRNIEHEKFDAIYFMHSIAHLEYPPLEKIKDEFLLPNGKVVVITPNLDWLTFKNEGKEIKTDPTVIRHYSSLTLERLFVKNRYDIICQGQFGDCINNQHERLWLIGK